jgi:pyrimidine-nucleoside phosphorylase
MYDIIKTKRDGYKLSKKEIDFFIRGVTQDTIPDYQISALMMAIFINGMDNEETLNLTMAIANSGDTVDLSSIDGIKADKHSTGGVGDKTTLIVVPIVASFGVKVAKMSGKGLGHTGGTIDKLESIKGYKTSLSDKKFMDIANSVGCSIIGQSAHLAPADKRLYALRDVTATVDCLPLIVSSIMGKKLAIGADVIVLDVKTGSGAFMKTFEDTKQMAEAMVAVGKGAGKKISALITNMDMPLGYAIGNSLEVIEAVEVLRGYGPKDLKEVCIALAAEMLYLSSLGTPNECIGMANQALQDGTAYKKFVKMVNAHGGNTKYIKDTSLFEKAKYSKVILSTQDGYLTMNTEKLGVASLILGAGRIKKEDDIDLTAGIILYKKTQDYVKVGDTLAVFYTNDESLFKNAEQEFYSSLTFALDKATTQDLILARISVE